jgi:superfamily II DNA/RNA helicase
VRVEVAKPATTAKTITQLFRYCPSTEDWEKREVLRQLIRSEKVKNAIIFCNRKRDVAILLKSLQKHGFNAGALHGDMDQMSRTATLDAFREGRITLLAASDVAARGLDIPDVSHIFNFDVPWQSDDYVHRIGRTGRAGKEGRSLTLVTPDDIRQLKDIEKMLGAEVTWIDGAPSAEDIADGSKRRRGRGGRGARPSPVSRRAGSPPQRNARHQRDRVNGNHPAQPQTAAERPGQERAQPRRSRAEPAEQPQLEARAPEGRPHRERHERRPARAENAARPGRQNGNRQKQARPARQAAQARQPWEPREPRRQPDRSGGPTPVGLGDHVPAFLRKTTRTAQ